MVSVGSGDGEFHHELVSRAVCVGDGFGSEFDKMFRHFGTSFRVKNKKADVAEHPEVFDHVGLLTNEPLGTAGVPSI